MQRGDAAIVALVAVNNRGFAVIPIDDRRGIFLRLFDLNFLGRTIGRRLALPALDLLDATHWDFVERDAKFLDQVLAAFLDEIGVYSAKCSELSVTK